MAEPWRPGPPCVGGNLARRCRVASPETERASRPPRRWKWSFFAPVATRAAPADQPPVKEPEPLQSLEDFWTPAAQMATVGIFVILLGACLYFCRALVLPIVAAVVVGTTLAPIVKAGARHRVSPWVTAIALGVLADRRRRPGRHVARQPGRRMDRQGAGDRRDDQAEALRARSSVGGIARTAGGLAAVERPNGCGRTVAIGDGHAGAGLRHPGGDRGDPVLRDVDLLPRHADGFSQVYGVVLHHPRRQASLSAHCQRDRGLSRLLCRNRDGHQFRLGRGGRARRMAVWLSQPDHLRNVGRRCSIISRISAPPA